MFQIEDFFFLNAPLFFYQIWKSHLLFGASEVASVWGLGSCICLGLWKSHQFGAVEVTSVWGCGSHIYLGLWKSHLFGAVEITSAVWGFGSETVLYSI